MGNSNAFLVLANPWVVTSPSTIGGGSFFTLAGNGALGSNLTLTNSGFTTVTVPGGLPATSPAGLLVQPSNSGRFTHEQVSFVPELGLNLGYEFNKNLRLVVGYTLIVWTDVLRPEDQVDRTISPQTPGLTGARPAVNFQTTTFWAQGLTAGVQLSF